MSKSPSLRRIQADIRELALDPSDRYHAAPLENDMFEWHFTIRGADDTDFAGGVYHGRIMLPPEYPFKPPHIIFLTPSGRFETNTKVCLSFSAYHPELWQPAWGIRLILEALISFLPTPADGAIGALDWTSAERKRLAQKSVNYSCSTCGCKAIELLPKLKPKATSDDKDGSDQKPKSKFQKEIEKLQQLQHIQHGETKEDGGDNDKKEEEEKGGETTKSEKEAPLDDESKKGEHPNAEESTSKEEAEQPAATTTTTVTEEPKSTVPPPNPQDTTRATQPPPPREDINNNEAAAEVPVPQVMQQEDHQPVQIVEEDGMLSWMVDPVLHGIIVVLAVLCFFLMRKLQVMKEELDALNDVLEG